MVSFKIIKSGNDWYINQEGTSNYIGRDGILRNWYTGPTKRDFLNFSLKETAQGVLSNYLGPTREQQLFKERAILAGFIFELAVECGIINRDLNGYDGLTGPELELLYNDVKKHIQVLEKDSRKLYKLLFDLEN